MIHGYETIHDSFDKVHTVHDKIIFMSAAVPYARVSVQLLA